MGNNGSTEKVLVFVPVVSGSISALCSLLLMIRLLRHRRTLLKKVKERLLLGMSVADLFFSLACAMSTFPGPSYLLGNGNDDDELYNHFQHYQLRGTRATCNFQGWLYQLGVSTSHYNACLCFYYYLAICRKMRDSQIRVWIEPLMHTVIWLWALVSAFLALSLNATWFMGYQGCFTIDPSQYLRCDIQPNLPDCQASASPYLVFLLFVVPNVVSFSGIFVFVVLVYREIRWTEKRGRRWTLDSRTVVQQTTAVTTTKTTTGIVGTIPNDLEEKSIPADGCITSPQKQWQDKECDTISIDTTSVNFQSFSTLEDEFAPNRQPTYRRLCCSCDGEPSLENSNSTNDTATQTNRRRRRRYPSMTSVATETGIQYVVGYLITFTPGTVQLLLLIDRNEEFILPLSFVVGIVMPLQGFWNWIFYTRGRLKMLRARSASDELETNWNEIGWREQLNIIFFK